MALKRVQRGERGLSCGLHGGLAAALLLGSASAQACAPESRTEVRLVLNEKADRAFLDALMQLTGDASCIRWKPEFVPRRRMVAMVEHGGVLGFALNKTPERAQSLAFSQPVLSGYAWLVARQATPARFDALADLQGRKVCVPSQLSLGPEADAAKDRVFIVVPMSGASADWPGMLRAGRCELMVVATHLGPGPERLQATIPHGPAQQPDLVVLAKPLAVLSVHFAVKQGDPLAQRLPALDRAILRHREQLQALAASR